MIGGLYFNFVPYDYGPYDKDVYRELENLAEMGLVGVIGDPSFSYRKYRASGDGLVDGAAELDDLPDTISVYIRQLSSFVRRLSFSQLVRAVYQEYPEMKENSVFR